MHYEGTLEVNAPKKRVYDFLLEPKSMAKCLPELKRLEIKGKDSFQATVRVGVGFIKGDFTFNFVTTERTPPFHARLVGRGSGKGSNIDLDTTIDLEDVADSKTRVRWKADALVSGLLAGVGQRIIQGTAEKAVATLFRNVKSELERSARK